MLLGIGSPFVRQLVAGVVLIALMVLVLPLAIVVFIVTSLLYYVVVMLLGIPSGTLGAVLGFTWFGGSLALIGWLCVLAWRRLAVDPRPDGACVAVGQKRSLARSLRRAYATRMRIRTRC